MSKRNTLITVGKVENNLQRRGDMIGIRRQVKELRDRKRVFIKIAEARCGLSAGSCERQEGSNEQLRRISGSGPYHRRRGSGAQVGAPSTSSVPSLDRASFLKLQDEWPEQKKRSPAQGLQ